METATCAVQVCAGIQMCARSPTSWWSTVDILDGDMLASGGANSLFIDTIGRKRQVQLQRDPPNSIQRLILGLAGIVVILAGMRAGVPFVNLILIALLLSLLFIPL